MSANAKFIIETSASGLLRIIVRGELDERSVAEHWAGLERIVPDERERHGKVKVVVDASAQTGAAVEEPATSFAKWARLLTGAEDRLALVVSSSLAKVGMKTSFEDPRYQVFVSRNAAETWASAYG